MYIDHRTLGTPDSALTQDQLLSRWHHARGNMSRQEAEAIADGKRPAQMCCNGLRIGELTKLVRTRNT